MSNTIGNQKLVLRAKTAIEVAINRELAELEKEFGIPVESIYVDLHKNIAGSVVHTRVTINFTTPS